MSPAVGRTGLEERLQLASVLVEIGDLGDGEARVLRLLADQPQDREALSLLAKIKHIRGELSAAFACWAQIHALAAEGQGAHMRLASMLRLAQDPERGAGEFLALGQNQLWRKPAALLELESAFRLFVALRPDEARAACSRLAQKSRDQDRDVHKLAVLAERRTPPRPSSGWATSAVSPATPTAPSPCCASMRYWAAPRTSRRRSTSASTCCGRCAASSG